MAHDFSLTRKSDRESVYFFGYYCGLAYDAFNAHEFNNGLSGSNDGKFVSKEDAIKGCSHMINKFKEVEHYAREVEQFTKFLDLIKASDDSEQFAVHYS